MQKFHVDFCIHYSIDIFLTTFDSETLLNQSFVILFGIWSEIGNCTKQTCTIWGFPV